MNWKNRVFANFKLYAVTDLADDSPSQLEKIAAVYKGGADIIQLRSKKLSDRSLFEIGKKIRALADKYQKLFFVNDRADLALAVEADGVHLGQNDLPVETVRSFLKKAGVSIWIGKSTHSLEQGMRALDEHPDYLGVGPVFETPTKPGYKPAGLQYVAQAAEKFKIPFVAIGGINEANLNQVLEAGAHKIAVVRAVFDAQDSYQATCRLREMMEAYTYAK